MHRLDSNDKDIKRGERSVQGKVCDGKRSGARRAPHGGARKAGRSLDAMGSAPIGREERAKRRMGRFETSRTEMPR